MNVIVLFYCTEKGEKVEIIKIYGYIRVSSRDQNEARQVVALKEFGIPDNQIYIDKQSGKDFERPKYKKMVRKLKEGDLLVVKSIDRLGRHYEEILMQWSLITKTIKADILVLDMPLLDTRKKNNDLTGTFIADLVLQILSYVAQTERDAIKQRQAEGIEVAKKNGVRFGRKPLELPENFMGVCDEYKAGILTVRQEAQKLSMCTTSFYRKYADREIMHADN